MFMRVLPCGKTLLEWSDDAWWNEFCDVSSELGELFDKARTQEQVTQAGGNEDGRDVRLQAAVHERHLEFAFKVGNRAQPPDDDVGSGFSREVDGEPVKSAHLDIRAGAEAVANHLHPLLDAEERMLARILEHGDDHPVEDQGGAIHHVQVAVGQGVEAAGVERGGHEKRKKLSRVLP